MKWILYISVIIVLTACTQKEDEINQPDVLLDRAELIDVIVDVQILESYYKNLFQRPEVYVNALDSATFYIFENHGISKSIFEENLNYYIAQPDTLFLIYESALDTVNNRINSNMIK